MSEFANNLIDLDHDTPDVWKPSIRPLLAGLMRQSMDLDRVHAQTCDVIRASHKAMTQPIIDEIDDLTFKIELLEIRGALGQLCDAENLDRLQIVHRLQPRCEMHDDELLIFGRSGHPVSFEDAVCELVEDE